MNPDAMQRRAQRDEIEILIWKAGKQEADRGIPKRLASISFYLDHSCIGTQSPVKIQNLIAFCVAGLLLTLVLAGCQSTPPRLTTVRSDWIEDGRTTLQEVTNRLGAANLWQQRRDGTRVSHYMDSFFELTTEGKRMRGFTAVPATIRYKSLSILTKPDGTVFAHLEHLSVQPIQGPQLEGGPKLHNGPLLDAAAVGQIKRGETNEKDLMGWFGEPALEFLSLDRTPIFVWIQGSLASSIVRHANFHALSVALDDHETVVRHSVLETEDLGQAMSGLILH